MQYREVGRSGLRRRSMQQSHLGRFIRKMTPLAQGARSFINSWRFVASTHAASGLRLKHDTASREASLSRKGVQSIYKHYGAPALRSDELMSLSRADLAQGFLEAGDV